MKTIKVFLASSDELQHERLQFDSLFNHLNRILRPRGLYLELSKWEYLDSSMGPGHKQEEYNEELKTCQMCIVIYWTRFGEYTREELMTAYNELKEGRNPQKLYVFFKEPSDVTPELKAFKESFATEYGHFYCKFENVDSMRLHFLLQLETFQNSLMKDVVKVEDSKVKVNGTAMVDLDNIPFAAKNKEYRRLKDEIAKTESEITTFESVLTAGHNDAIVELLGKKRTELYYLKEELAKHENILFDTALRIVQQQSDRVSKRMARAIEAFEDGRANDANTILDEALHDARQLRESIGKTKEILKHQQESAAVSISELTLKASVVLADESKIITERIRSAKELYEEAYSLANECDYDKVMYGKMLIEYTQFLYTYAEFDRCLELREELLGIQISVLGENDIDIATTYNNIGLTYYSLGKYDKALEYYEKDLGISLPVLGEHHPDIATTYSNLGCVYDDLEEYETALDYHQKALKIRKDILGRNHPDTAESYNNIGALMISLDVPVMAFLYYDEALDIKLSVLGEDHPDVAVTYCNLGATYKDLNKEEKALEYYEKAWKILSSVLGDEHPQTKTASENIKALKKMIAKS